MDNLDWRNLPMAQDMAPYAEFYQEVTRQTQKNDCFHVVELGVRYGCSARIILKAIVSRYWTMTLVDPVRTDEALQLLDDPRVFFYPSCAEDVLFDHKIDLLHIDVDPHTYEQLVGIWPIYSQLVQLGGAVIFHDATHAFGVRRFVDELAQNPDWHIEYCPPHPDSPISAPAVAWRIK